MEGSGAVVSYEQRGARSEARCARENRAGACRSNIVRHEYDKAKGFGWEVVVKRQAKVYRRYFSDSRFRGSERALQAAISFRDDLIGKLPLPLKLKRYHSRNTSGIVGISIIEKRRKHGIAVYIRALWPQGGYASFSVDRLGFRAAWENAVAARLSGIAALQLSMRKYNRVLNRRP